MAGKGMGQELETGMDEETAYDSLSTLMNELTNYADPERSEDPKVSKLISTTVSSIIAISKSRGNVQPLLDMLDIPDGVILLESRTEIIKTIGEMKSRLDKDTAYDALVKLMDEIMNYTESEPLEDPKVSKLISTTVSSIIAISKSQGYVQPLLDMLDIPDGVVAVESRTEIIKAIGEMAKKPELRKEVEKNIGALQPKDKQAVLAALKASAPKLVMDLAGKKEKGKREPMKA